MVYFLKVINKFKKLKLYQIKTSQKLPITIEKAMEWINKAYKDSDDLRYWHLRYKALIYEKAGKLNRQNLYMLY